jgi:hypothetical protein
MTSGQHVKEWYKADKAGTKKLGVVDISNLSLP